MDIDLLSKVIIPILGLIITYVVVPYVKAKVSQAHLEKIKDWVSYAVFAAEQMEEAGLIEIPKKEYVVKFINDMGFKISEAELNVLIESAVKALNLEQQFLIE